MVKLSPIQWAARSFRKFADFSGRASRAEYWWFYLLYAVLFVLSAVADSIIGTTPDDDFIGLITMAVAVPLYIPLVAASVRRLHDIDKSGLWYLIEVVPLIGGIWLTVLLASRGTSGANRFGPILTNKTADKFSPDA